jgi:hypothetical protein
MGEFMSEVRTIEQAAVEGALEAVISANGTPRESFIRSRMSTHARDAVRDISVFRRAGIAARVTPARMRRDFNALIRGEDIEYSAYNLKRTDLTGLRTLVSDGRRILVSEGIQAVRGAKLRELIDAGEEVAFWTLSRTHAGRDACDELAEGGPYSVFDYPDPPHPWCQCMPMSAAERRQISNSNVSRVVADPSLRPDLSAYWQDPNAKRLLLKVSEAERKYLTRTPMKLVNGLEETEGVSGSFQYMRGIEVDPKTDDVFSTLAHEAGHAIDYYWRYPSAEASFARAIKTDRRNVKVAADMAEVLKRIIGLRKVYWNHLSVNYKTTELADEVWADAYAAHHGGKIRHAISPEDFKNMLPTVYREVVKEIERVKRVNP